MAHQPAWGPSHQRLAGAPGRGPGGYWWAIGAATLAAAVWLGYRAAVAGPDWWGIAALTAGWAAVGGWEAETGRRFASGRGWLFAGSAAVTVLVAWAIPAATYVLAYYGVRRWRRDHPAAPGKARGLAAFRRDKRSDTVEPAAPQPLPALPGGYFGADNYGRTVSASPRGAAMVIGPPGSGKTQSVIMPSVAYAPAACVSTSVKAEVLAATMAARQQRGRVWLFDPGGAGAAPPGVLPLRWNPLCDVTDWDAARSVATRLTGPSRRGGGADLGGDHWTDRAESWLATLLFAAAAAQEGGDIAALARWCMSPTSTAPEAEAVIILAQEAGIEGADIAGTLMTSLLDVPDKERESIASTLSRIMNIYTSSAALKAGIEPNFDVETFVRSTDTVYITAPVDRQRDYAPLIAGFLESIRLAQYHRRQAVDMGTEIQTAPVTFVLDEAANTAPIPLPNVVSEAGGQGLHLVVAFQDLSQAHARWGKAADGFLTLFPEKLVLSGMADRSTAEMLSKMSGEYDRMTIGVSEPGSTHSRGGVSHSAPGYNYNTHRTPVLSVADITGVPRDRGLYWSPRGWQLLTLQPWWRQRGAYGL